MQYGRFIEQYSLALMQLSRKDFDLRIKKERYSTLSCPLL